jgi:hypothetical protein
LCTGYFVTVRQPVTDRRLVVGGAAHRQRAQGVDRASLAALLIGRAQLYLATIPSALPDVRAGIRIKNKTAS